MPEPDEFANFDNCMREAVKAMRMAGARLAEAEWAAPDVSAVERVRMELNRLTVKVERVRRAWNRDRNDN